jgi:hypothetical protein
MIFILIFTDTGGSWYIYMNKSLSINKPDIRRLIAQDELKMAIKALISMVTQTKTFRPEILLMFVSPGL